MPDFSQTFIMTCSDTHTDIVLCLLNNVGANMLIRFTLGQRLTWAWAQVSCVYFPTPAATQTTLRFKQ